MHLSDMPRDLLHILVLTRQHLMLRWHSGNRRAKSSRHLCCWLAATESSTSTTATHGGENDSREKEEEDDDEPDDPAWASLSVQERGQRRKDRYMRRKLLEVKIEMSETRHQHRNSVHGSFSTFENVLGAMKKRAAKAKEACKDEALDEDAN